MSSEKKCKERKSKLSKRLALVYAALFIGILLVLSAAVFFVAYEFLIQKRIMDAETSMPMIIENILHEVREGDALDHGGILTEQNVNLDINMFLRDADGMIVNREYNYEMDEERLPISPREPTLEFWDNQLLLIAYEQPLIEEGETIGFLYLVLNLQHEKEFLELLTILLICANVVGAFAALITGWVVSRRMLAPIQDMIGTAKSIDESSLKARLEVPQPDDELKQLALTINSMLDRVERAFAQQGQFAANASHELRTPLAILQGNVDMLKRWAHDDPEVLQDSIAAIGQQTAYMGALVENLLFLARGDSTKQELHKERFSARSLMKELYQEQSALDEQHIYSLCAADECMLYADRAMIRQMLRALIDNSVKFTPAGGSIILSCENRADGATLSVQDTGVGIEQEHITHIFDRFYRVDKARSKATGGMGLGLSIVDNIAKLHDGRIEAESIVGKGTRITAVLPNT